MAIDLAGVGERSTTAAPAARATAVTGWTSRPGAQTITTSAAGAARAGPAHNEATVTTSKTRPRTFREFILGR